MTATQAPPRPTLQDYQEKITTLAQQNQQLQDEIESLAGRPSADEASTNFYWTFGEQEVFNLQTTVRAALTSEQIAQHINSVIEALKVVVGKRGHAKAVGHQPQAAPSAPQGNGHSPAPASPPPGMNANGTAQNTRFYWEMKNGALDLFKGKPTLVLVGDTPEPQEIACPVHSGKVYKRKANDNGAYLSHKDGDGWCNGRFKRQ